MRDWGARGGQDGSGAREHGRARPHTLRSSRGCPHWRTPLRTSFPLVLTLGSLLLTACEQVEQAVDARRDLTPHEAYAASLGAAGLAQSALGRDWVRAADAALAEPLTVGLPYREEGFLPADDPTAIGLRVALRRGQVLTVQTSFDAGDSARVFVDLFRVPDQSGDPLRPLARVDSLPDGMVYEPYRDGDYVLRLQPELLRGGRYRVVLSLDPSLSFPVSGIDAFSIGSSFGASRDGGRRDHHGVDIFAARGTTVLAASDGMVYRVEETNRGGRVVWVRDDRRQQRLYYAHLDRQLVEPGRRVRVGDTLGLVGNTGNARTTPPHLHFGVYARGRDARGPQDPLPYLARPRARMPAWPGDPERLGSWARVSALTAPLRTGPAEASATTAVLSRHTPVWLLARSGGWWRVRLPDGRLGWLAAGAAESAEEAVREAVLASASSLRERPIALAPVVEPLPPGSRVHVLGEFSGHLWVRGPGGRAGWVVSGQ